MIMILLNNIAATTTGDNDNKEEGSRYSLSIQNVPNTAEQSTCIISTNSPQPVREVWLLCPIL